MGTKQQFKMYLPDDLVEKFKDAAERLGKNSGQEVAAEILSIYFPVWLSVNESLSRAVEFQINLVAGELAAKSKKGAPLSSSADGASAAPAVKSRKGIPSAEITLQPSAAKKKKAQ